MIGCPSNYRANKSCANDMGFSAKPFSFLTPSILIFVLQICTLIVPPVSAEEPFNFDTDIRPLLDTYCVQCHNTDKAKGDLDIARFTSSEMAADALGIWQRVAKRVMDREMPPKNAQQPSDEERERLMKWVAGLKPTDDCNKLTSEQSVSWYPGYVMSRRLNRAEYENTIRDLFGMEISVAEMFPADGAGGEGFDNTGGALFLSPIQLEKYLEAADFAVETALPPETASNIAGTRRVPGSSEYTSHSSTAQVRQYQAIRNRIITAEPKWKLEARDAARAVLREFAYHAWRRPVEPVELEGLLSIFDGAYSQGDTYYEAVKLALKGVLVSPHFIFLAEPEPEVMGDYALGDFPFAARLSYFIWGSMPDAELFRLAQQGLLQNDSVLEKQLARMLKDEKARALGELFASQWLGIVQLGQAVKPDPDRFPSYDEGLRESMRTETEMFFNRIIREDRSLLELINSDYTFVDKRLAELYGIEGVRGEEMQLVQLADASRGGVLGMPAILTATSHPLRTSPVLRGKWVLETILGDHVPPPPPNVPSLPEDDHPVEGLSFRQQMEAHRENPECASCHSRMDPIGFGLENFDPIGRWRDTQSEQPIDAQGVLPSGETFNGAKELKEILLARKDDFARNFSRKMLGYALGRDLTSYDLCIVDRSVAALTENDYRPSLLFREIVMSYPFRHRYSNGKIEETPNDEP